MLCFCLCHTLRLGSRRPDSCADKTLNSRATCPAVSRRARPSPRACFSGLTERRKHVGGNGEKAHFANKMGLCVTVGLREGARPETLCPPQRGGGRSPGDMSQPTFLPGLQEAFRGGEERGSGRGSTLVFQVYVCFNFPLSIFSRIQLWIIELVSISSFESLIGWKSVWPGKIPDHSVCSVCTLFLFKSLSWKHGALQQVRAFVDLPILSGCGRRCQVAPCPGPCAREGGAFRSTEPGRQDWVPGPVALLCDRQSASVENWMTVKIQGLDLAHRQSRAGS